ncbi:MAG: hypothetical protein V1827_00420 [Candidatus Micrarchaeota archaeon]
MAEESGNAFGGSAGGYRLEDLDEMEKASVDKANKAISAIENAMAVWEASAEKPEELKPRIIRLRYFYEEIMGWEKKALQTLGRRDSIGARVERLKEFNEICFRYA